MLAREAPGIIRGQENGDSGDVAGLARAAKRGLSEQALFEVGAHNTRGRRSFGFNHTGVDGIDADFLRSIPALRCMVLHNLGYEAF
jgi:hypothetical protein